MSRLPLLFVVGMLVAGSTAACHQGEASRVPSANSGSVDAGVPCEFRPADPGTGERRTVSTPAPRATATGTVPATITTNLGDVTLELDAAKAPCTVHSFVHLAEQEFFDGTDCHRLTTAGIWVLQCGDPSGTGTGSPGYALDDENLPASAMPPYPRGTLAMANAGPGTGGSQFFLVYRDSDIPPNYTVFGTVTGGLELLDKVAAAGTDNGTTDGRPMLEVQIEEVTIGG